MSATFAEARGVLESAATLAASNTYAVPPALRSSLTASPQGQDELLGLISVTGAIRVNSDALPQSLIAFVLD